MYFIAYKIYIVLHNIKKPPFLIYEVTEKIQNMLKIHSTRALVIHWDTKEASKKAV